MKATTPSRVGAPWILLVIGAAAIVVAPAFVGSAATSWAGPGLLAAVVVAVSSIGLFVATAMVAVADRRGAAEPGLLGAVLLAVGVLSLASGLSTPGVVVEDASAHRALTLVTLPIAALVAAPILGGGAPWARPLAVRWRDWTLLTTLGAILVASSLVFVPDVWPVPSRGSVAAAAVSLAAAMAIAALVGRQLRHFAAGRHRSHLLAAGALLLVIAHAAVPLDDRPLGPAAWWAGLGGTVGVVAAAIALWRTPVLADGRHAYVEQVFEPVLRRDPLLAVPLGSSPAVRRFVDGLERTDRENREHTIRTAELVILVGERFGVAGRERHELWLAAVLHDIGKLRVPDEILSKPGRLTAEEYEVVKLHTVHGEDMTISDPVVAPAASIVRSHHERLDGSGYPDGLVGREIPLAARIIAVCDAFDAMTHARANRPALPVETTLAVLQEHAGSHWDPIVIDRMTAVLPSIELAGPIAAPHHRGRPAADPPSHVADAVDVAGLLHAVDAQI